MNKLILLFALPLLACESESARHDRCLDQAADNCAYIGTSVCKLSQYSSNHEWNSCKPYIQCEDSTFDQCMDN